MAKYPLVASSDCSADMKLEAMDVCISACERHPVDLEKCTQVSQLCMLKVNSKCRVPAMAADTRREQPKGVHQELTSAPLRHDA